jgi:hypothetical protein
MRLPRPKLTLKQLLVVIAIAALNCAYFRSLYQLVARHRGGYPLKMLYPPAVAYGNMTLPDPDGQRRIWSTIAILALALGVGFIPLANAACLGSASYIAHRVRSYRSPRAVRVPAPPAGFTLFALHLLGLGCILITFVPTAITFYTQALESGTERFVASWSAPFVDYNNNLAWFAFDCIQLCGAISGPLLFLSWLGGRNVRRSAATLSLARFRILTALISLGFATAALAIVSLPFNRMQEYYHAVDLDIPVFDNQAARQAWGHSLRSPTTSSSRANSRLLR